MVSERPNPGRRIAVYGPSGSGKTTLARRLSERLAVPYIELDALFHQPGWQPAPRDEFRAKVAAALVANPDGWVVDGNYSSARDIVLAEADTAVWIRLPFWRVYPRLVTRTLRRAATRELLWGTNRERWRDVVGRDSMLVWGIRHWRRHHEGMRASLAARPPGQRLIVVRSPGQVEALVDAAGRDGLD
jgi:adenylate kinase family enzyme